VPKWSQAGSAQIPLVPLLVFVRQYFSMLPKVAQNAAQRKNREKHNINGHEIIVSWP
jgi:hypothetical protein